MKPKLRCKGCGKLVPVGPTCPACRMYARQTTLSAARRLEISQRANRIQRQKRPKQNRPRN